MLYTLDSKPKYVIGTYIILYFDILKFSLKYYFVFKYLSAFLNLGVRVNLVWQIKLNNKCVYKHPTLKLTQCTLTTAYKHGIYNFKMTG